ncbi:MAG: dienelactone hydrolase family protein [Clostridia bacterium]|nr:dienelactone hydrolase family protein [Clostridia bacterium]
METLKENFKIYSANSNFGLVIFTGLGGDIHGYQNKYVKIAERAVENYNTNVFVVGVKSWQEIDTLVESTMQQINTYFVERGFKEFKLYAMGVSAGATFAVAKAHNYASIKKVLAVNPVINICYNKLAYGMENSSVPITFVFGDKDPSMPYLPILEEEIKRKSLKNTKIKIIKNADHQFVGMLNEFIDLPFNFLW